MQAAVFDKETGVVVKQTDIPVPSPGEVLLAVEACGICGSDRQIVRGESAPPGTKFPVILGHEIAGSIVQLGAEVDNQQWHIGDAVVVYPFIPCGVCRLCQCGCAHLCLNQQVIGYHRAGGYAEFVVVPASTLLHRPDTISALEAALLVDAFATPFHALMEAARVSERDRVLVMGAGGLGMAALLIAQAQGCQGVAALTRRNDAETEARVRSLGAEQLWPRDASQWRNTARQIRRWSDGGADVVLDTEGTNESIATALQVVRPGGRVCLIGMQSAPGALPSIAAFVRRGIELRGSYGSTPEDLRTLLQWTTEGRLHPGKLVSEVVSLSDVPRAIQTQLSAGRTVIRP